MPGNFGISDGHFGERAGFATGFIAGILLHELQSDLDGFAEVDERFRLRFPLTPAAGQRETRDSPESPLVSLQATNA